MGCMNCGDGGCSCMGCGNGMGCSGSVGGFGMGCGMNCGMGGGSPMGQTGFGQMKGKGCGKSWGGKGKGCWGGKGPGQAWEGVELAANNETVLARLAELQDLSEAARHATLHIPASEAMVMLDRIRQKGDEIRNVSFYLIKAADNYWSEGRNPRTLPPPPPAANKEAQIDEVLPSSLAGVAPAMFMQVPLSDSVAASGEASTGIGRPAPPPPPPPPPPVVSSLFLSGQM